MATDVPGTTPGSNLSIQEWDKTIEPALYDYSKFLKKTKERQRGYSQLNIRKITPGTGQTLTSAEPGINMTFDSMNPAVVNMQPAWFFIGHQYPDSLPWYSGNEIDRVAAEDCENALAAYIENQFLADVATLTNFIGNGAYDFDAAGFRAGVAQLATTALTEAEVGKSRIYALLNTLQMDDALSVPEFTHADQRGDGQNPLVSGMISKGIGVNLMFTTLLNSDTASHGVMWVESAFGHYWNKRASGEKQRYLKQTRVMCDAHFAHGVVHNARALNIRTKLT